MPAASATPFAMRVIDCMARSRTCGSKVRNVS
jgi:hypothetical protein